MCVFLKKMLHSRFARSGALRRLPRFGLRPGGAAPLAPGVFFRTQRIIYDDNESINNSRKNRGSRAGGEAPHGRSPKRGGRRNAPLMPARPTSATRFYTKHC